jgi:hypothetical protein
MAAVSATDEEKRAFMEERRLKWSEARVARERWAREHGAADFKEAIKIGLQVVGRMRAGKLAEEDAA